MLLEYALAAVIGLALGVAVNWLANVLPGAAGRQPPSETLDGKAAPAAEESDLAAAEGPTAQQRSLTGVRYVLVELVLAGFAVALLVHEGWSVLFGIHVAYVTFFALVAVIDIEHRLVLNVLMLPAFAVALVEVLVSGRVKPLDALAGYAIAQILVMGFYLLGEVYLWVVNSGRDEPITEVAFGFGDVTLATFCGLVVGFPRVVPMLVLMILFGAVFALLYLLIQAMVSHRYHAHTPLPYGPSILLAATLLLVWGEAVARFFGAP